MFYLVDAAIFCIFVVALLLNGLAFVFTEPAMRTAGFRSAALVGISKYLGLISLILWIIGINSIKSANFFLSVCLIGTLLNFADRENRTASSAALRSLADSARSLRGLNLLIWLYVSAVCLFTFVLTLAPPTGNDWDSLMYHLAVPQQYLRHGKIVELPYDHHSYFPFTMEMLFMWGLALRGPVLAKLFHWLMLPLCCAVIVAIGKRQLSLRAGLLGAALFASIPIVQMESTTAYIDLGLTAFVLMAYLSFANWKTTGEKSWLISCGVFCGFCLGTKYLGVLTLAWLGLWILDVMFLQRRSLPRPLPGGGEKDDSPPPGRGRGRAQGQHVKPFLVAALLAILIGGGWYGRNWVWTGNPVYPFAYEIFGGKNWSAEMARQYTEDQKKFGFGRGWEDLLAASWRVSMAPLNLGLVYDSINEKPQPRVVGMPWWPAVNLPPVGEQTGMFETPGLAFSTVVGPALLAFGLPLLFIRRKPWIVGFLGWSFLFYVLFWFFTGQYVRYLIPAFALWCVPCGWMIERFLQRSAMLKWITALSLVAWCLFAPLITGWNLRSSFGVIFGSETPEDYLIRTFRPYPAMRWASQNTPENARIAVYGEPRTYYLDRDYFWADDNHNNLIDYARVQNGAGLKMALRAQGATHVLWQEGGVFGPPLGPMQDAVQRGLLEQIFEARGCRVYRISS